MSVQPKRRLPPAIEEVVNEVGKTQVVIMAGGMGRRMGLDKPKPLLEIGGKTLIDRCIEYYQDNGYTDITVLVGYKAEQVEAHVKNSHPEVKTCRDPFNPEEKPVGKAKALKHALQVGVIDRGRRAVITFPDDIFLDPHLPLKLLMRHIQGVRLHGVWATAVFAYPARYPYGKAEINGDGLVTLFVEKPKVEIYTSTGIYLFEPPVYDLIMKVDLDAPHPVEFEEEIIPHLAQSGKLYSLVINSDIWIPINTQKDLERAIKTLEKANAEKRDEKR